MVSECEETQLKFWNDQDIHGELVKAFVADDQEQCMNSCLENKLCKAFSFDRLNRWANNCWLKEAAEGFKAFSGMTTGARCDFEKAPQSTPDGVFPETGTYLILKKKSKLQEIYKPGKLKCMIKLLF